jgi:hypothetical protein
MDEHQFLARLVAAPAVAAITDAMRRALGPAPLPRLVHDVPCPDRCGATIAVWSALNRRFYPPGGGAPLGTGSRKRVKLVCRCGARRDISGRGYGRHLRDGRPPFG